jgi:hypothetical protein
MINLEYELTDFNIITSCNPMNYLFISIKNYSLQTLFLQPRKLHIQLL